MTQNIEDLANEVHSCYNPSFDTVDLFKVAQNEGILLAPGQYGEKFHGRIEFHRRPSKFFLYYPEPANGKLPGKTRFSIAHELGHYFIPSHYEALLNGKTHNSLSGFICDNKMEKEADEFASILLIPTVALKKRLNQEGFMPLRKILELANYFSASATCAAIRYAKVTREACAVLVSTPEKVLFYTPSREAVMLGFGSLPGKMFPRNSATAEAHKNPAAKEIQSLEGMSDTWHPNARRKTAMWEESFSLGYTNLALTLLAFET